MKILVVSSYSGGGQQTEAAVNGSKMGFHCIHDNCFDTNTVESIEEIIARARKECFRAVVIDNHWTPSGFTAITHMQIDFAAKLIKNGIETFVLTRTNPDPGWDCELWRIFKPLRFKDMKRPVSHMARIGNFGQQYLKVKDGSEFTYSGGDGGLESLQHALRNFIAFRERNWIAIKKKIIEELS